MSNWYKTTETWVTRVVVGTFMPDLAKQMHDEGLFDEKNIPTHIEVEDNGADITIFSFSGFDVLFAGLARFEFRSALKDIGEDANFVFIRDIHRTGFHLSPTRERDGLSFFEAEINRVKQELGSSRNVAVGSSSGGMAALYFASRCAMDEAIVFGAVLSSEGYKRWSNLFRSIIDIKLLFREPAAYFESLVVVLGGRWGISKLKREYGSSDFMNPLEAYGARGDTAPKVTYYYGARSHIDAWHAAMLEDKDAVRLVPLPTGRHNTPSYLKQRGQLSMAIAAAIDDEATFDPIEKASTQAAGAA